MDDLLRYALRSAPSALIPAVRRDAIARYSATLPAVVWAGFELRLEEQAPQVDVHLGIRSGDPGACAFFAALGSHTGTDRFARFCELWCDPGSAVSRGLEYLVLEFDIDDDPAAIPALFIAFREELAASARLAITHDVLRAFDLDGARRAGMLQRLFSACHGPERVSHIGVMLSRSAQPLRVNVRGVARDRMVPYLNAAGHPGSMLAAEGGCDTFLRFVDRFTLCLDASNEIADRLGVELTLARQPHEDPRHAFLFDELAAQGLCAESKVEALLRWPGLSTPAQHGDEWPEALLLESLTRPAPSLSAIERRLSHIKLDVRPGGNVAAKAYFGLERVWLDPERGRAGQPAGAEVPETAGHRRGAADVGTAIGRALTFLDDSRHQSGWWRDYPDFPIAASDEWPTAYAGCVLCDVDAPAAQLMARQAWALLDGCGRDDGWGWSRWTPADADSTGWALRLAAGLGIRRTPRVERARRFLQRHQRQDGGIATYLPAHFDDDDAEIDRSPRAAWYGVHTCVTGAAAHVDGCADAALGYLRNAQQENGCWSAFWWPDDVFATALATRAIGARRAPLDRAQLQRAASWVLSLVDAEGAIVSEALADRSAFATANGLSVLVNAWQHGAGGESVRAMDRMAQWLTATQQASGGWAASALLYYPDPYTPPDNVHTDCAGILTTATVLAALNAYHTRRPPR